LWQSENNFIGDAYNFSQFAASLNECEDMQDILPPTDSRRRLDRHFLERGDTDAATHWKRTMEDRQRQDKKKNPHRKPNWFKEIVENTEDTSKPKKLWIYCGDYWEQRSQKIEAVRQGKDASDLLYPAEARGYACDFSSYGVDANLLDMTNTTTTSTEDRNTSSSSEDCLIEDEGESNEKKINRDITDNPNTEEVLTI